MRVLAVIALALLQLTPLGTHNHAGAWLESLAYDGTATTVHQLIQPAPHQALAQPVKVGQEQLSLGAASALAVDMTTAQTLYEKDADARRPIASVTKLASALVLLRQHGLDDTVTVPQLPSYTPEDEKLGLVPGQRFKFGQLLAAMLVPSDNDAADALAIADSGTIAAFSAKMNAQLAYWGIDGGRFVSASGLTDTNNFASARALAKIAKIVLTNPEVVRLAATKNLTISDLAGHSYSLTSTDQLLGADPRIRGLKTGFTGAAGQCFVALANIGSHQIITVVLNSPDRFGETQTLLNFIERNYKWQ